MPAILRNWSAPARKHHRSFFCEGVVSISGVNGKSGRRACEAMVIMATTKRTPSTRATNIDRLSAVNRSLAVTDTDIGRRAFALYCERGRQDGQDLDDWLRAERELRAAVSSTAA